MGISERGEERIVTIYVDVLVALNLYVTWFLLLASEALSGRPCKRWRRGLAALAGGLSSLAIFLPELPFLPLFFIKLGLAAVITWIAGGRAGFWRRMGFFFAANFLFAGVIIALWLMAAPPRLIIRNGVVYYHIQAMTLAVSTVIAYAAARLYVLVREKTAAKERGFSARLGYRGKEVVLNVLLDTGNRLKSLGGLPVVVCDRRALESILPREMLESLENPAESRNLQKIQLIPCETVGGGNLLAGFAPDYFVPEGGKEVLCLAALSRQPLRDGFQAIAGPACFPENLQRKEGSHENPIPAESGPVPAVSKIRAFGKMRLHKRGADPSAPFKPGGGTENLRPAEDPASEGPGNPDYPEPAAGGVHRQTL